MSQERLVRHQRPIFKRIIVRGVLILDTPTCLGNGDADSPTDLALLRDRVSDHALLTGSSIAGALRNYLREYEHGYGVDDQLNDLATALFGGTRSDANGEQSPIIVNDAISSKIPTVELRDGVEIEGATGTASKSQKYDLELLAAGTEFPLYFELLIEHKKDQTEQKNYQDKLIKALALVLQGLERGEIGIGMKKQRGFGCCHVDEWQVWQFDLTQEAQRLEWLQFEHWCEELSKTKETHQSITTALGVFLEEKEDKRDRLSISATFKLVGSLLIRSGQNSTGRAPDVVHLTSHRSNESNPVPVLSGTSLAGVLRHRAERIVNTLGSSPALINQLFGFVQGKQSQASRLVVHEKVIEKATDLVQSRIAIDRFTGGTFHGALFDEQPVFGGNETRLTIELELRKPEEYEIGLLLLLLKDLWTSDLPVGGESSIGRGRLQGLKAEVTRYNSKQPQKWTISDENEALLVRDEVNRSKSEKSVKEELEGYVQALLQHLNKDI